MYTPDVMSQPSQHPKLQAGDAHRIVDQNPCQGGFVFQDFGICRFEELKGGMERVHEII